MISFDNDFDGLLHDQSFNDQRKVHHQSFNDHRIFDRVTTPLLHVLILSISKVHFKMRGTNCKICEYSLDRRNIVDFLPEIPSCIRKLNFQSLFGRKYHFHCGKK